MHPYLKRLETEAAEAEGVKDVPLGIAFNVETALTQARMARKKIEGHEITSVLSMRLQVASHLESVIEQLEEIDRKVKGR